MESTKSLGEEKIGKLLLKFSIPCITALLISAFYNIVDQIFIGNSSLGYLGNAATGISFPIICIANAFAWCVGDGAAAYLSICAGRNDRDSSHKCVGTGITATLLISITLSVLCLIFIKPLMSIFGASDLTLQLAIDYFKIIALFFPFYLLLNVMNSMIRADGSPTYAMIAISIGAVVNIILDPIFIFKLDMGIKGAAIATVIGQILSFIACAVYFIKPKSFKLSLQSFKIDPAVLKNLITMGGATFITQIAIVVMTLLSNITLAHFGALSKFGSDIPISVFSIQTKVYTILNNIVVGIALGGQPILGYNYGAGKIDRVKKTYKLILISSLTVGIIFTCIFEFFPQLIINIFGSGNELYLEFAIKTFRIYLSLCLVTCITKMTAIFFQSIGKSLEAMLSSIIRDIVCIVTFTLALAYGIEKFSQGNGIYGILFAAPLSDIVAGSVVVVLTVRFFRNLKTSENKEVSSQAIKPSKDGIIITIAREHGSCGKEIGRLLAQKLNIPFYYKEMTALAAQESGLAAEFISDLNQNSSSMYQLYLSSDVVKQAVIAQEKIIRKIADNGSCVIVGRAADYVLKDYKNVLSVFLYAPTDVRIQNVQKMYGDSYEDAVKNVQKSTLARSSYYRGISGKDWCDPHNYDLCIDTSIGAEKVVEIISSYTK